MTNILILIGNTIISQPTRIRGFFRPHPQHLDFTRAVFRQSLRHRGNLPQIRAVLEKYADLPADFADASLVALCERIKVWDVASVDGDFTIYRGRDKRRFNNLFFDV